MLNTLFNVLNAELPKCGCDHSFRIVRDWCHKVGIESGPVEAWLRDNGGYCDCEALANAEQQFSEAIRVSGK